MKTVGVKVEEIKSTPLKAAPNGFEPTSPEARAALDSLVKDSYAWFQDLVKTRRNMDDATLEQAADGRVFTGRQAIALKLVDQLGDEKTAVAWLVAQKKIDRELPVRDFRMSPRFSDMSFIRLALAHDVRCGRTDDDRASVRGGGCAFRPWISSACRACLALWRPSVTE